MTWQASFAPLRSPIFAWYYASRSVNTLGSMMAGVALTFAVLDLTDSATALGQVLAARTIPLVLLLLYGGVISDRFSRTVVLQVANLASAATQGVIALLVLTGTAELWSLLALSAVNGAVSAISFPAMASVLPQLVSRDQLQPANALMSISRNGLSVLGPTVAALLVVTVGPGWALAVDAASWLVSALLLVPIRLPRPDRTRRTGTVAELREGWTFFRTTTWLWVIVLAFGALNAITSGAWNTLGPLVAQETIGRQAWGWALSAEAAGLLVMAVITLRVPLQRPLLLGMLAMIPMAGPLFVLGIHPSVALLVVMSFVAGAGVEVFSLGWNLAMQEHIDEAMLSRAYSYDALGSFVAMPIGQLVAGPLAGSFGLEPVLVGAGVAYLAIVLLTLASRSVRDLPRRVDGAAASAVH